MSTPIMVPALAILVENGKTYLKNPDDGLWYEFRVSGAPGAVTLEVAQNAKE